MPYLGLSLGPLETNCYLLWNDAREAWIIDPGYVRDADLVREAIAAEGLTPRGILLTHAHFDHIGAVATLSADGPGGVLPVYLHPAEHMVWSHTFNQYPPYYPALPHRPATLDTLPPPLDGLAIDCLDTPGHSPGGVTFHLPALGLAFVGDALFAGSVGRTDLPGSNGKTLMRSIREVLFRLPPETVILPGHGPASTIGRERRTNPYVGDDV